MSIVRTGWLAGLATGCMLAFGACAATAATAPAWTTVSGVYNQRYCELLLVSPKVSGVYTATVFNTIGQSTCPSSSFNALDLNAIKASDKLLAVLRNGPRWWTFDSVGTTNPKPPRTFGKGTTAMRMSEVAAIRLPALSVANYAEIPIVRTTRYAYNKGRTVRELISPTGVRYAMQSYTGSLTEPGLKSLGTKLRLPARWTYSTRVLSSQLVLTTTGTAKIIRDDLLNTYQRES